MVVGEGKKAHADVISLGRLKRAAMSSRGTGAEQYSEFRVTNNTYFLFHFSDTYKPIQIIRNTLCRGRKQLT